MTLHDAAMFSWRQWWLRAKRAGYAYALVNRVSQGAIWGRNVRSILAYGVGLPVVAVTVAVFVSPWALTLLVAPLITIYRVRRRELAAGRPLRAARAWAWSCVLSKAPGLLGVLGYYFDRLRGSRRGLIEYKS